MRGVWGCALLVLLSAHAAEPEDRARQVLAARCWACHGQTALAGLRLDSREAILKGGKSGPAVSFSNPQNSRLLLAIRREPGPVKPMPPGASLTKDELTALESWVRSGAPWTSATGHWAFQPLARTTPGATIASLWTNTLRAKNLHPAPPADRRTLIRRAAFDLTGLPPDPDLFSATMADSRPAWFAHLIDRLLASSHFGEKWGRHWLDVARYGEEDFTGTEPRPYPNAWRFREWVVDALNRDLPYDRFLMAQIAGDLMQDESLIPATALLGAGPWYYGISQPPQARADERNDRVDVVSRGMLGVTLACARCHDHKYDPFTIEDYYAFAGVFASTAYKEYPLVPAGEASAWQDRKRNLEALEKQRKEAFARAAAAEAAPLARNTARYLLATHGGDPGGLDPQVLERWKKYLAKPEENHPFLKPWHAGPPNPETAAQFQALLESIVAEKNSIDEENRRALARAETNAPKVQRTIVLPGGYRSDEDFNPGADVPAKGIARDRYVAYSRTFTDRDAPFKLREEDLIARNPELGALDQRYQEAKKNLGPEYPFHMGVGEFEPWDLPLHLRGNPENLGPVVPRRFPIALSSGKIIPLNQGSGRLRLAGIVARHPLAARVAVNRIWMALFGQGLVRTPSNFGAVGDRPALPEVLEHLAARFRDQGYSMKAIIREIMLSPVYQLSAAAIPANESVDPGNRFVWRQNRRRLEAEILRDAMLAATGELDRTVGGPSSKLEPKFNRRTLYGASSRFQPDETLSLFDLPSASVTCEQRVVTNVPLQKLYFLNSEAMALRAEALARAVKPGDIAALYERLFQRPPTERERSLARAFLSEPDDKRWREFAQVLLSTNEFAYVD